MPLRYLKLLAFSFLLITEIIDLRNFNSHLLYYYYYVKSHKTSGKILNKQMAFLHDEKFGCLYYCISIFIFFNQTMLFSLSSVLAWSKVPKQILNLIACSIEGKAGHGERRPMQKIVRKEVLGVICNFTTHDILFKYLWSMNGYGN